MGSYCYKSLYGRSVIPYRSRIEALYTLNSKPAVSFKSACMVRCVRLSITMSGDYREFRAVLEQAADQDFGLPIGKSWAFGLRLASRGCEFWFHMSLLVERMQGCLYSAA